MSEQFVRLPTSHKENEKQGIEEFNKLLKNIHIPRYFRASETPFLEEKHHDIENKPVGLQNLGSTCWFNVVIQLLYHIPCFRQHVIELTSHQNFASNQYPAILGLQDLFLSIMFSERKLINPSSAVYSIGKILGNAEGQQDASEFLGLVLDRLQRTSSLSAVDRLFTGTLIYIDDVEQGKVEGFMQYVLQVDKMSSLNSLIESNIGLNKENADFLPCVADKLFLIIPPILCIDLCRMTISPDTPSPVKINHMVKFQPWVFMDQYIHKNRQEVLHFRETSYKLSVCKQAKQERLQSLQSFLENITPLPDLFKAYEQTVEQSSVNFKLLTLLNSSWETEIQRKMNELYADIRQLEEQESFAKNEGHSKLHPYRLHAVIVHQGESNQGHYWIFVWNLVEQCWYHIDDTFTQQVAWEDVSEVAFGGLQSDSSAQCLVFVDALKVNHLLDLKEDYQISYADPLSYLKDHTDIRTRNIACGKIQSLQALFNLNMLNGTSISGSNLLFHAIDKERKRLFHLAKGWNKHNLEEEVRLLHIGVYFIINKVEYEPYIFWSLLQHFASYALLTDEKNTSACNAARHALVFLENSTSKQEKDTFVKFNAAYYKFRLASHYMMHAITQITGSKINAAIAIPAAIKALCTHYFINKLNMGPAMSINPNAAFAVIKHSVKLLSNQLLEADIKTTDEMSFAILIDGLKGWCTYSLGELTKAARDVSRDVLAEWLEVINTSLGRVESNLDDTQMLQRLKFRIEHLWLFLENTDIDVPEAPFEYKGHLPTIQGKEEEQYHKWKELWILFQNHSVFLT